MKGSTQVSAPTQRSAPRSSTTALTARPTTGRSADHAARSAVAWLIAAMGALAALAVIAAIVSWDAQYVMIASARHSRAIAALEAGIPDVGAAVFAALGIALALHGRRALRPRVLNIGCVGLSIAMNSLAAAPGWRATAIWVMPAAVYALASDTLIGVVRSWTIARSRSVAEISDSETTPLGLAAALLLWLLRLVLAPTSTLSGFRRWVLTECPAAPGPRYATISKTDRESQRGRTTPPARTGNGRPRKQDLLIALAAQRHDLKALPLQGVASIASSIGHDIGLHPGTARRILRAPVRDLQAGGGESQQPSIAAKECSPGRTTASAPGWMSCDDSDA